MSNDIPTPDFGGAGQPPPDESREVTELDTDDIEPFGEAHLNSLK